jgi:O-antigen ligase
MHIHLGSLAGIIALCFILVIFAVKSSMVYLGKLRGIIAGIFILLMSIAVALSSNDIRADAQNAADFTKHFIANPTKFVENRKEPLQGNEVRLILWTASVQLGIEHPMGLGLGGLEPALAKKLKQWGYPKQAEKEFNPHNQFLQVWNEIGLVGLFFFICLLYLLFMDFYSKKELSKLLLLIAFIIYCLFESFLQRASGIVFFLCWFTVLSYLPKKTLQ